MGREPVESWSDSDERWKVVEEILLGVGDRAEGEIPGYLDRACQGDPELRGMVDSLLVEDSTTVFPIEEAVVQGAVSLLAETPGPEGSSTGEPEDGKVPERVGSFRLLEKLGSGGSGTVYRAERADDLYRQQVAIKLLRQAGGKLSRRFAAERQILADLDHPNIARLLDGGTTPDGTPYFVMELVEGEPIDVYCDRRKLSVSELLDLFVQVCSAVHFAHRNLVVHRDLKPSNVYVTAEGVPKLLDFGIAKLVHEVGAATAESSGATFLGDSTTSILAPMTPRYASPEQLLGRPVTTASDIYSLGLLLYLLLTGRHPLADASRAVEVWERRARGEMPTPPSQAVCPPSDEAESGHWAESGLLKRAQERSSRPRELAGCLAGDLDAVVARALENRPERRYSSAAQLAEDLRRHRSHRPVRARPQTLGYRTRCFVRRHRFEVAGVGLTLLILLGAVLALVHQAERVAQERDRANQVSDLLADLFEIADPDRGSTITARELLDRGAERVRELPAEADTAGLLSTLARLYGRLGLPQETVPLYERVLEIQEEAPQWDKAEVAETLNALAIGWASRGQFEKAEEAFERALELRQEVFGIDHSLTTDSVNNLALVNHDLGRYTKARRLYEQALAVDMALHGPGHPGSTTTVSNLALLHLDEGDFEGAHRLYGEALAQLEARHGPGHEWTVEVLSMKALALAELGDAELAAEMGERAVQILTREDEDHPELDRVLDALGTIYLSAGNLEAATEALRRALELRLSALGPHHAETAWSLEKWADLKTAVGEGREAEEAYRQAIAAFGVSLSPGHPLVARAQTHLAALLAESDRCTEAMALVSEAEEVRRQVDSSKPWLLAEVRAVGMFCQQDLEGLEQEEAVVRQDLGAHHRQARRLASWQARLAAGDAPRPQPG